MVLFKLNSTCAKDSLFYRKFVLKQYFVSHFPTKRPKCDFYSKLIQLLINEHI